MGVYKKLLLGFLNKRRFSKMRMYSFYRRDLWGFLRWKRQYNFKRSIYKIFKNSRKFYYYMLNFVYKGIRQKKIKN